jgi:hypothetical protein
LQITTKNVSCHTADSEPVKWEVNGKVILPPLVIPDLCSSRDYKASSSSVVCKHVVSLVTIAPIVTPLPLLRIKLVVTLLVVVPLVDVP